MPVKRYYANWYEHDEFDQWIESSVHDTLQEAKRAAFIGASRGDCHLYCEVNEYTLKRRGWDLTLELVNHHDSKRRWSGWISPKQYDEGY